jgi:transcriptional regulator with XRE-family HTH domain
LGVGRVAAAPVAAPYRHDGPEIARCFGELVAEIRKKLPLRPVDAAYRAWISRGYWGAVERGTRLPSLAVFIMVARSLGMDPRELLDALLERMHYGRGAPPVFQGPPQGRLSEAELEYQRLMAAARNFTKVTEVGGPRLSRFHSGR